jgi:Lon protease-like protein
MTTDNFSIPGKVARFLKKDPTLSDMTNFVPIFPLSIVVFPGEQVNLHIFEPKYKQLILECAREGKPFGIPTVLNERLSEYGTLVHISSIEKTYDSGEMDITTSGLQVLRVLELVKDIPEKLYSGAIVSYPANFDDGNRGLMQQLVRSLRELHELLHVQKKFSKEDLLLRAYDIAHHVGLSLEEEYEFLQLTREIQRQEYLKRHLSKIIPMLGEMEALKEKIKLNGHFKELPGFNFDK